MSCRLILSSIQRNRVFFGQMTRAPKRLFKSKTASPEEDIVPKDGPIKYSTSKAAKWKARYSASGEDFDDTPDIQGLIVVVSLSAFMIHFFILREENDLDDYVRFLEVNVPLQIQVAQIQMEIGERKKAKKDVSFLEKKLEEILRKQEEVGKQNGFK